MEIKIIDWGLVIWTLIGLLITIGILYILYKFVKKNSGN